jgi:hypothetical protein
MVSILADGVVFHCPGDGTNTANGGSNQVSAEYLQEVPVEYFNARFNASPRLLWHFGYEQQRQSLHESRKIGTYFQVRTST